MEPTVTGYDILFVFVITGILGSWGWRVTQGRLNLIRLIATGVGVAVGFVFGMMLAVIFLAVFEFNTTVRYVMLIGSAVLIGWWMRRATDSVKPQPPELRESSDTLPTRADREDWRPPRQTAPEVYLSCDPEYARIRFAYVDKKGDSSVRDVKVVKLGQRKFQAYDLGRKGLRTFLFSGVQGDVTIMETGELMSAAAYRQSAGMQ